MEPTDNDAPLAIPDETAPKPAEGSPAWWWKVLCAREADLERAAGAKQEALDRAGKAMNLPSTALKPGQVDPKLQAEVIMASELVGTIESAIADARANLLKAEQQELAGKKRALLDAGEAHARAYLEASARLQDAIEQVAATLIETYRTGVYLVQGITHARKLVPPGGRAFAGDVREALSATRMLRDRVQVEIVRRTGHEMWPGGPDVPAAVSNCPLVDQNGAIASQALVELAATLNLEED